MSAEYKYTRLTDLPNDTIRLLQLHPGEPSEMIRCTLSTAQLRLRPKFAALSYVWGTEPASEEIVLNSKQFWIRKNLWQCLIRLREPTKALKIWIDAICVDQEDIPERNQQVKFMNHIFGVAKPVLAWLGEDVGMKVNNLCGNLPFELPSLEELFGIDRPESIENALDDDRVLRVCRAVTELCKCQYWSRVWIVQEVLVAQKLVLCFAGLRIAWEDFDLFCNRLWDYGSEKIIVLHVEPVTYDVIRQCQHELCTGAYASFIVQKRDYGMERGLFLHQLITTYGSKECIDRRDKVYALLGLRKHRYVYRLRNRPQLQADYGRSNADLFFDVVMFEGLPNSWYAETLRQALNLQMHELQQASLLRRRDTFESIMKLGGRVQGVLFNKVEEVASSGCQSYSQFLLIQLEEELALPPDSGGEADYLHHDQLLAVAMGKHTVRAGDFVFRIQHSSLFFAFRYERSYFRPIAKVENFMAPFGHHQRMPIVLPKDKYVPMIDFEVWNGLQVLEYGPDVLLEVIRHHFDEDSDFNFEGWPTNYR